MSNWISSKLKAAESILQQIDQQAAESLKKGDTLGADEHNVDAPIKSGVILPLKDQLKKKNSQNTDYNGKLGSDPSFNVPRNRDKEAANAPKPSPKPKSTLTDSDWTELLGTPNHPSISAGNHSNEVSSIRGLKREAKKPGNLSSSIGAETKKSPKNAKNVYKLRNKLVRKEDGGQGPYLSDSAGRNSGVEMKNYLKVKYLEGKEVEKREAEANLVVEPRSEENQENDSKELSLEASLPANFKSHPSEMMLVMEKSESLSDMRIRLNDVQNGLGTTAIGKNKSGSDSNDAKRDPSISHGSSCSDTESGSSSDSEIEREREERRRRRKKILAEKAAAKAVEAIKEQENMVARLEGEKESLEKILEERARQQAEEALELQSSMMETMEAVELEKQKHDNTRMEALARLAKLETTNADLARSFATVQRNLEVEINQVAELRQKINMKEMAHEELSRRMSSSHPTEISLKQLTALKGVEFEREILEEEYYLVTDKVLLLQEKAKNLGENIELMRKEVEEPTEVEVELKRRLEQMTDHLIQKQAQVETLSSEKATISFRIEAVTRLLEENESTLNINYNSSSAGDLELGRWDLSGSKLRPLFEKKMDSGKRHLGYLVHQLDSLYVAGTVFLRRNPVAKVWSTVYLVCLHLWFAYIFLSDSEATNEAKSGAVVSLENINNTS